MLHVVASENPLTEDDFWNLYLAPMERSLAGPPRCRIRYAVAMDAEHLWFGGKVDCAPDFVPSAIGFTPELWKHDCLELFVASPASGRYVEFNLAPGGGWWSCVFAGPRLPDDSANRVALASSGYPEVSNWRAVARASLADVRAAIGDQPWTANFTAIVGGGGEELDGLHSVASLGAADFHRPHEFLPLTVEPA